MNYRVIPPDGYLEGRMKLPLSKSMSNRALIINRLTPGAGPLTELADCDDTRLLREALADDSLTEVNVGAAGTAMRFLTAYFASQPGRTVRIDGSERMRQRPIGPLVDALNRLGGEVEYLGVYGFPPLKITGKRLKGGSLNVDSTVSSQYISALLMVAPTMEEGLTLELEGETVSLSYIKMTLAMMESAGVESDYFRYTITVKPGQQYSSPTLPIEPDWSAASYGYEIQSLASGEMVLEGLEPESVQGDSRVAEIFSNLGVETEFTVDGASLTASPESSPRLQLDLSDNPDLVPAIVVTCALLGIPFRLSGLETLRIKETDRLRALRDEVLKLGIVLTIEGDGVLVWEGARRPITELPVFDTYDDHRMAMALAPVALFLPGIVVRDADVVTKSFPEYWNQLEAMGFRLLDPAVAPEGEEDPFEPVAPDSPVAPSVDPLTPQGSPL